MSDKTRKPASPAGRYIRYAVGEILLVMIGILLALQVNNWNEERKENIREVSMLENIVNEIRRDTTMIANNMDLFRRIDDTAEWLRVQLDTRAPYTSRMDTAFATISIFSINEPNYTVFDNLESIGVSLIRNDSLRNEIMHYYTEYRQIASVDDYFAVNKYFREQIYPKYFKNYRYARYAIPADKEAIYDNTEFSVALDYCINDASFYMGRLRHMREVAFNLITMIEKQLGS